MALSFSKNFSTLSHGITSKPMNAFHCLNYLHSKHMRDFNCLNCFHSFRTENKLKSHEKECKNKDCSGIVMPSQKVNILQFNQYIKCDKMP